MFDTAHRPEVARSRRASRQRSAREWALGAVFGVLALGPALGPGALLNLDFAAAGPERVPSGVWALGPTLPRRVPTYLLIAWVSQVVGTAAIKALLLVAVAASFAGAARLVGDASAITRVGAGALYAWNPFLLTRISVGHLTIVVAAALLPWVLVPLVEPTRDLARVALAAGALGLCGVAGGLFAVVLVAVGAARDRHRLARRCLVLAATQLPWVVPGVFVHGHGLRSSQLFVTHAPGLTGPLRVAAGHGFWQLGNQLGSGRWFVPWCGAALLVLAGFGHRTLARRWRGGALAAAVLGFAVTVAPLVPGVRALLDAFTRWPWGAALREPQRLLPLFLVWLAPAAARGAERGATALARLTPPRRPATAAALCAAAPAVVACLLAAPGLWGMGGRLAPVSFPRGWSDARAVVSRAPNRGTILALPWHQYLDLSFAAGRRTLYPAREWFDGDVLVSGDPELDGSVDESADPRTHAVLRALAQVGRGEAASPALAALGVRWVFVAHEAEWRMLTAAFDADSGLSPVPVGSAASLYAVRAWAGGARTGRGAVTLHQPLAPVATASGSAALVWNAPYQPGWLRGFATVHSTADGLRSVPGGRGVLWYWPAAVALLGDVVAVAVATCAARSLVHRRSVSGRPGERDGAV